MDRAELLALARTRRHGVEATVSPEGAPQAALVGFVLTDALEVFFDTTTATRKHANLRGRPRVAFVVGGDGDAWTIQLEGLADEPAGDDLARLKRAYFAAFPDGSSREAWPDIAYVRVRPTWLRVSDYRSGEAEVTEWQGEALARLVAAG